jgi:hypothetical protein
MKCRASYPAGEFCSLFHALSPNLDEEMFHFAEGLGLTNQEKTDIIAFLLTFTDDEFLTNPAFSDPNE